MAKILDVFELPNTKGYGTFISSDIGLWDVRPGSILEINGKEVEVLQRGTIVPDDAAVVTLLAEKFEIGDEVTLVRT